MTFLNWQSWTARTVVATVLVVAGGALLACDSGQDLPPGRVPESDLRAVGASVYATNCAACHGERGEGQPNWQSRRADGTLPAPPHDSSGHTWHHSDAVLVEIVTRGGQASYGGSGLRSGMPAFGDSLTGEEVAAVLTYIKSLWGDDERAYQASLR